MSEIVKKLFTNRRGAVVLIPVVVLLADLAGVPIAAETLNSGYDQAMAGVMSLLAAWSLFRPQAAE